MTVRVDPETLRRVAADFLRLAAAAADVTTFVAPLAFLSLRLTMAEGFVERWRAWVDLRRYELGGGLGRWS